MEAVIKKLLNHCLNNEVLPALNENEILEFEKTNNIILPNDYRNLLKHFDGGEILIPGPTIFGIQNNPVRKTIKEINAKKHRKLFSIPNNYLIFAKLNYGDFICIDLNSPNGIVQWDHENDVLFCEWKSLKDWLEDMIASFEEFEGENK